MYYTVAHSEQSVRSHASVSCDRETETEEIEPKQTYILKYNVTDEKNNEI